jgi:hypothetical protein
VPADVNDDAFAGGDLHVVCPFAYSVPARIVRVPSASVISMS